MNRLPTAEDRGAVLASAGLLLTIFAFLAEIRMASEWAAGVRLLVTGALTLVIGGLALTSSRGRTQTEPWAWEATLYVSSFVLLLLSLGNLADALGGNGGAGTTTWVSAALVVAAGALARGRNSAIMTLAAGASAVVMVLGFINWVGDPGLQTDRWFLLLCALGLTLGAVWLRDRARRHAVSLVDVAGLCFVALGATLLGAIVNVFAGVFRDGGLHVAGGPNGWELVLLVAGLSLIGYGAVDRERVPPAIGVLVLSFFVSSASVFDVVRRTVEGKSPSLVGWPLILLIVGLVLLALAVRPRATPPEPPVHE